MTRNEQLLRTGVDALAALGCAAAALVTLANVLTPIRSGLTVAALVLGTGWAATCWIRSRDAAMAATLAIGAGVSIICFYALIFVEVHWWHPIGSVGGLLIAAAGVNLVAVVFHLTRTTDRADAVESAAPWDATDPSRGQGEWHGVPANGREEP